jgi:lipoprotein-releasing system permease protein
MTFERWELGVALRYLLMARKRGHTAFLTIISTLGLAVGVATLLISLALLSGLQGQIKDRLIAATPQVLIEPVGSNAIEDPAAIRTELRRFPGATVRAVVSGMVWASDAEGKRGRPVYIRSLDEGEVLPPDESYGRTFAARPRGESAPIYLSRDFANSINLFLGDEIIIVNPSRQTLTPFGPVPVYRSYRVERILRPGLQDKEPDARLPFQDAARLFGTGGRPSSIEVYAPLELAKEIEGALDARGWNVLIRNWEDINKPLFLALRLEKVVMFVTISLIIFVAALNLVSSVAMLIVEKRPQVGVLRTLGASERSILFVYLGVGLFIGVFGTLLGNLIGLGVSWASNRFELIPLPQDVYAMSHLPFLIEMPEVVAVNAITVILSILATWYPARLAARLDPIAAISSR